MLDQEKKWTEANAMDRSTGNTVPPSYPNEVMVKVFSSGTYSSNFSPISGIEHVLDIGCGAGNNLVYFVDKGCTAVGIDVTDEMVGFALSNLDRLGYSDVPVQIGSNTNIPFPDNEFDIILSVNTLHYSPGASGIDSALREFTRVLRPGGKAFIMTAGPRHDIVTSSKQHGEFDWEVLDFGFRTGNRQSFFDDKAHFKSTLSKYFKSVDVGGATEEYPSILLEFMFAICTN